MDHSYIDSFRRIILRPLEEKDIESLRLLRNRERRWFIYSNLIDEQSQKNWFSNYLKTINDYMFSVSVVERPNIFIGSVALYNFTEADSSCEFGRILIDCHATTEKGLGFDTTVAACKLGFMRLGLNKIILEVYKNNIPAVKTYLRAGFVTTDETNMVFKMMASKNEFIKNFVEER